jgi:hypothetical protein
LQWQRWKSKLMMRGEMLVTFITGFAILVLLEIVTH